MSPNIFSVKITPFSFLGLATMSMAAESTRWWSRGILGNSASSVSVTIFLHSLELASTLALSIEWIGRGGFAVKAICAATLVILRTSPTLYIIVSQAASSAVYPFGFEVSSSCLLPKYKPPISSRTTMKSTPLAISSFNGLWVTRESEAKDAGRILAYNPSSFRRARIPCSGRTGPTPHLGPPTEPNQIVEAKCQVPIGERTTTKIEGHTH